MIMTRRSVLALAVTIAVPTRLLSADLPKITVTKDPNCGCCSGWVEHLRKSGFPVETIDTAEINRVKGRLGIPNELWACHTGEGAGYIFEGHVPAPAMLRFLAWKPKAWTRKSTKSFCSGLAFSGPTRASRALKNFRSRERVHRERDRLIGRSAAGDTARAV